MTTRQISSTGLEQIKQHEALRLFAYPDPASPLAKTTGRAYQWGMRPAADILTDANSPRLLDLDGSPWTCGYGHTKGVAANTETTRSQADQWLLEDVTWACAAVEKLVKTPLSQPQFDALVSLVFNIGETNFAKSTLLKRLNAGNYQPAAYHFGDWIKVRDRATGKLVRNEGLYVRRNREKALFMEGLSSESHGETPVEVVAPESRPPLSDPTITVPVTSGLAATGAALSEAADKASVFAPYSETLKSIFILLTISGIILSVYLATRRRGQ